MSERRPGITLAPAAAAVEVCLQARVCCRGCWWRAGCAAAAAAGCASGGAPSSALINRHQPPSTLTAINPRVNRPPPPPPGVDIIEAGFPVASPDDFAAVKAIAEDVGNAVDERGYVPVICGLSRTRDKARLRGLGCCCSGRGLGAPRGRRAAGCRQGGAIAAGPRHAGLAGCTPASMISSHLIRPAHSPAGPGDGVGGGAPRQAAARAHLHRHLGSVEGAMERAGAGRHQLAAACRHPGAAAAASTFQPAAVAGHRRCRRPARLHRQEQSKDNSKQVVQH